MTPERWQQVKHTLAEALERTDETERAKFVDQACADDADLRREIDSLLAQPEDEFDTAAEMIGAANDAAGSVGRGIGAYELVHELGRGGMGTVWLARRADRHFEKQVAIKLLKRGTDTDEVLRRFSAERQILARLDHPNIARLLDAGTTDDDLPYFVMEYVQGEPVSDFVRGKDISLGSRLEIFLKVCSAVQFAHQNLVVHRDLKPGNILVNENREPKLLDFGIAKLLDESNPLMTATLQQRLTPEYASPEQVSGGIITTVSDVYSLGVVLYELLTGSRPYKLKTGAPEELTRAIREQEPVRPSTVSKRDASLKSDPSRTSHVGIPKLSGDLDNIVLMALRKEPARRYQSVALLADDIKRYLDHRPIRARRDSRWYRAGKFVQRNKLGVAAGVVVLLTLAGGIVATTLQARVAQQRFNDLRQFAHSVLFDYHDAIANLPGSTVVRKKLVTDSLQYLDKLAGEGRNDESLEREIAAAYLKVGDVQGRPYYPSLGDLAGATVSYGRATDILDRLTTRHAGNAQLQNERVVAHLRLSEVTRESGQLERSRTEAKQSLEMAEKLQSDPSNDDLRETLALACTTLGDVLGHPFVNNLGDSKGAMELYQRALAIREQLRANDPQNGERFRLAAIAHSRVGTIHWLWKDAAAAMREYEAELALDESLLAAAPNDVVRKRAIAIDLSLMTTIVLDQGDIQRGRELLGRSVSLNEQIAQADPNNVEAAFDLATSYSKMIPIMAKSGDGAGAREFFEKALAIYSAQLAKKPDDARILMTMRATYARMADALLDSKQTTEALAFANQSVATAEQVVKLASRVDTLRFKAHSLLDRARIFVALSDWPAARADYEESIGILDNIPETAALPMDKTKRDEARAGMAKCQTALASHSR